MATELPFPLYSGFFPQMVLTVEELMHYRRFGKERVAQLVRIIDDADCVYRWTDAKARGGRAVARAQFLDIRPSSKQPAAQTPSTLLKCSVHIVDVQPEEILTALAKVKTRDARRAMSYLHGDEFVDTQTLLTFPTPSEHKTPSYSYRVIKWMLLKAQRREGQKSLDFCYLEYAGKRKAHAGSSSVVGFCVQESIARDREVPTLERYDILRGQLVRTGVLITKTHQSNILKVTAIAQIDGGMVPAAVRMTMEEIMVDYVAAVHRVKGLLERQRMGRLQYLDEWEWVSTKERKACAVCLRGFYFHRKHHCATCGEVVCSNCAPLRELDEPLDEHTLTMRVCSVCMAQAGSHQESSMISGVTDSDDGLETTTSTTNVGTETYEALGKLIEHVRQIRDTINVAISEAEEEEERHSMLLESGHGDPDAGAERYDEIYDRIMKIRETLDVSSSDFDMVLESIGHNDPMGPSDTNSDRLDSELAFSLSEGTGSAYESESVEFMSSRSSLLSASVQSLDHQDAGEPLPSPRPEDESAVEEARALEEAMQWVRQSEPIAHLSLPVSAMTVEPERQSEPEPAPGTTPTSVVTVSKNRGIERLAQKIGRLHQRLEASQRESENTSSDPAATVAAPVGVPPVVDENAEDEPEPEQRSTQHHRQSSAPLPALKQARGPAPQPPKEKHVAIIAVDAAPSSPTSTASRGQGPRLSEPSRAPPDLVASLRGVMNSSELTHAPPRRRSGANINAPSPSPPETPSNTDPSTSFPPHNATSRASRRPPPPPPPAAPPALPPFSSARPTGAAASAPTPVQGTTIYVFDPEDRFQKVQRRSLDRRPAEAIAAAQAGPDEVPSGSEDGEEANPGNGGYMSSSDEEQGQPRQTTTAAPLPPAAAGAPTSRQARARDESGELRELMEGLAKAPLRSRCSSGQSTGAPPTEKFDF
ncbi:hypothetical protein PHYSODRAFT_508397 [Phytophthora sojae]|uniref:FYVE-type domain-containing protein n=1 Tax=Phytophthora sojae (strain P6497) TaxID=1094619 RepID=G4ZK60_PHYSP|nr:hypothetical protein PHYSODRAFT_508397 [Phytophthora sojae]EGZ14864.1 hypothetical protein PHYSODRAFT_508397 [Phytophthora sojae]|eukprot:XP_009528613.1 hypothetical protein PHYSODRAFT_508397 [Phytophthora sojae]